MQASEVSGVLKRINQIAFNTNILALNTVVEAARWRCRRRFQCCGRRGAIARIGQVTQNNVKNANRTAQTASAMSEQVEATRDHLSQLVAVVGLQQRS
jgi:methyl-accepting chemotaxis protein